ncbi:hypothetical protein DKX38_024517 [Salix brachista]|uniref:aconitate hydratase n=1 Tax=Salix brachista TaxID=2182728 RepID=A0A5N5JLK1_9ROSI|nr:hypothetical protein DKX38_024517 [Salix brachista]
MIESLHISVAMYKRLYEEEHKLRSSYSHSSDAVTVEDSGRKNRLLLLEDSQGATKKAQEKVVERLRSLEEDLAKSKSDIILLQSERDKLALDAKFARERLDSFMKEFEYQRNEMNENLVASEELSRKLNMEVSVLKLEKEILSNAERRACDEVRSLSERVHRLQATLDTIHSAEEARNGLRPRKSCNRSGTPAVVAETKLSELEKKIKVSDAKVASMDGSGISSSISATEVVTDLLMAKDEIQKLKEEAQANKEHMLQYKSIAQVNETALKQMEDAHKNFKKESEKLKQSLEDELISLRGRISELDSEFSKKSEEVAFAAVGKDKAFASALAEITCLKEENCSKTSQLVALESQSSALKEDLEKEHERWRAAHANYERQVILQSETIQELTKTSQALSSLQQEASGLRKLVDAQKSENDELKSNAAGISSGSNAPGSGSDAGWQNVAAENAQASLHTERANSRTLMFLEEEIKSLQLQVRELSLLRESNMQLREENKHNFEECQKLREVAQNAKAHSNNLESLLRERQIEVEACKKEIEMDKVEKDRLEKRISDLLERCRNTDVEDYNRTKDDLRQMEEKLRETGLGGPKRPHDRVTLREMKADWHTCLDNRVGFKGFAIPKESQGKVAEFSFRGTPAQLRHGDVVIAAITSCTNTSNPSVMLGAALVARKACELELEVKPWIKTSLAPGSGVVTKYLEKSGLQKYLNQLGFHIVGYGCTTCIGNSGDIDEAVASAITENDLVAAAVLSGNRNFEGRVHPLTRANYLASPPLVVAYACAGTVGIDFEAEPIGVGKDGKQIFFSDIWPSNDEVAQVVHSSVLPDMFKATYQAITDGNPMWNQLSVPSGNLYAWDSKSTYIHDPPYFKSMTMSPPRPHGVKDAYCLLNFGDSTTTDHISPAGSIHKDNPAARYLMECGKLYVFDAAMRYKSEGHDTIILAGAEYGSGSSRDWAAKGPKQLGVKAVIAKSFERIHRNNLVGMGIIPLCFKAGEDAETLGLTGHERYSIDLPSNVSEIRPGQDVTVATDNEKSFTCTLRFDTEVELAYFDHGGILQYVIRNMIHANH